VGIVGGQTVAKAVKHLAVGAGQVADGAVESEDSVALATQLLAQVAAEKGAIYAGLGESGVAVINADDAYADFWRELNRDRRVGYKNIRAPTGIKQANF